jgi:hypothetical protein
VPDLPDVFIQVWHEAGGDYALEYRDGGPDRHFESSLDGPKPVIAAMARWASGDRGWGEAIEWQALELGEADRPAELELSDEERELLLARVRLSIVGGYATRAGLVKLAEDYLVSGDGGRDGDGEHRPVSREQATTLVDRLWLERVREQETWQGETDPERLARAFAALEQAGIVAREDFACCHSCGQAEIGAEAFDGARGFVYFHGQCTDFAAAGEGLTLYYGGFDGSEQTTVSVGQQVVTALEQAGLRVEWSGDPGRAIEVAPLTWHRRLVG